MKRPQKLALLAKIVQGKASNENIQQLRRSKGPGGVVIIYQPGASYPGRDDEVSFHHNGQQVTMPYLAIQAFTRYKPLTICFIPDNGRQRDKL